MSLPSRSLLQGKPYDSAADTDIRRLFRRIRKEQRERQERAQAERSKAIPINLRKAK